MAITVYTLSTFGGYQLPPPTGGTSSGFTFDDAFQPADEGRGVIVTTGTGPLPIDNGQIPVTFMISPEVASVYWGFATHDIGAVESSIIALTLNVLNVGLQALIVTFAPNTVVNGSACASATMQAQASGAWSCAWDQEGAPIATITGNFLIPSGEMTLPDGTKCPVFF